MDCIYEGNRQSYVHPEECIDCGACEPICPEQAIYYEQELPPELAHQSAHQAELLLPMGLLNGARKRGPLGADHPSVAALPRVVRAEEDPAAG